MRMFNRHGSSVAYIRLAISLAKCTDYSNVKRLFDLCPKPTSSGHFHLESNFQHAIIALAVFLVESNLRFRDKFLPYLLTVVKKLPKSNVYDDLSSGAIQKLPQSECFAFSISSLLSQIAIMDSTKADQINTVMLEAASNVLEQLEEISQATGDRNPALTALLRQAKSRHFSPASSEPNVKTLQHQTERVCLFLAPTLLGLLRGMARGTKSQPCSNRTPAEVIHGCMKMPSNLISGLYWSPLYSKGVLEANQESSFFNRRQNDLQFARSVFPHFRSILPHSLSHSLLLKPCEEKDDNVSATSSVSTEQYIHWTVWNHTWLNSYGSEYLLGQVASVYASRLPHRAVLSDDYLATCITAQQLMSLNCSQLSGASDLTCVTYTSSQLKALLKMSNILLSERFSGRLDSFAKVFWPYRPKTGRYPYRSLTHPVRLCWLLLIRDILYSTNQVISDKLLSSVQNIIVEVYTNCASELPQLSACASGLQTPNPWQSGATGTRRNSLIASAFKKGARSRFINHSGEDDVVSDERSKSGGHSTTDNQPNSQKSNHYHVPTGSTCHSEEESPQQEIWFEDRSLSKHRSTTLSSQDIATALQSAPAAAQQQEAATEKQQRGLRDAANDQPIGRSVTFASGTAPAGHRQTRQSTLVPDTNSMPGDLNKSASLFAFDLTVSSTAACIQILTRSVTEMADAESLFTKLSERIVNGIDLRVLVSMDASAADQAFPNGGAGPALVSTPSSGSMPSTTLGTSARAMQQFLRGHFSQSRQQQQTSVADGGHPSLSLSNHHHRHSRPRRAHMVCSAGLLVVVFNCIGQLIQRFPHLAKDAFIVLSDFLLDPSPTLSRLTGHLRRLEASRHELLRVGENNTMNLQLSRIERRIVYSRRILEHIRGAAIQSLCRVLLVDTNLVDTLLALFSRRLFTAVENGSNTNLMYHNAVHCLGHIGVQLADVPQTQERVHYFLQQNLNPSRLSPELEGTTLEQLGCLVIAGCPSIHDIVMDSLTSISARGARELLIQLNPREARASHLSMTALNVLANIATYVQGSDKLTRLLTRLLEHYVLPDVESEGTSKQGVLTSPHPLSQLIPIIGIVLQRLSPIREPNQRLHTLFRDFWLHVTIIYFLEPNSPNSSPEHYQAICEIASKSPVLLLRESLRGELQHSMALSQKNLAQTDLADIRNKLRVLLDNNAEATPHIQRMSVPQCIYLMSIYRLESICVTHSSDPQALHRMFMYLEDNIIFRDKFGMWSCITQVAVQVLQKYLSRMKTQPLGPERERVMDINTQFFLFKFLHVQKCMRIIADMFLTMLAKDFPHVMWSGRVLRTMLDLTQLLSQSLEVDPNQAAPVYPVPGTDWHLVTTDNLQDREDLLKDFVKRCKSIIELGLQWAPSLVRSHLVDYMQQLRQQYFDSADGLLNHAGLSLATECVLTHAGLNRTASSLGESALDRRPSCSKLNSSKFMFNLILRNRYLGEASGMLRAFDHDPNRLIDRLVQEFDAACRQVDRLKTLFQEERNQKQPDSSRTAQPRGSGVVNGQATSSRLQSVDVTAAFSTLQACLFRMTSLLVMRNSDLVSSAGNEPQTAAATMASHDDADEADSSGGSEEDNFGAQSPADSSPGPAASAGGTGIGSSGAKANLRRRLRKLKRAAASRHDEFRSRVGLSNRSPSPVQAGTRSRVQASADQPACPAAPESHVLEGDSARRLLREICYAPLRLFTTELVECCIDCWHWLVVSRPSFTIQFLTELSDAWQATIHQGLGVFAPTDAGDDEVEPLVVSEETNCRPITCNAEPHQLWVQFLSERLYVAQSSNQEQIDILFDLLQKSLAGEIGPLQRTAQERPSCSPGSPAPGGRQQRPGDDRALPRSTRLSCHVSALGVRCHLVEMSLSLLQHTGSRSSTVSRLGSSGGTRVGSTSVSLAGGGPPVDDLASLAGGTNNSAAASLASGGTGAGGVGLNGQQQQLPYRDSAQAEVPLSRLVLREKAYAAMLNYFAVKPQHPNNSGAELAEHLKALCRVWSLVQAERKYLDANILLIETSALLEATGRRTVGTTYPGTLAHPDSANTLNTGANPSSVAASPSLDSPATVQDVTGRSSSATLTSQHTHSLHLQHHHQQPSKSGPGLVRVSSYGAIAPGDLAATLPTQAAGSHTLEQSASNTPFLLAGSETTISGGCQYATLQSNYSTLGHNQQQPQAHSIISKRSSGGKRSAGCAQIDESALKRLYLKRRELVLILLASEIERLSVWFNPLGQPDLIPPKAMEAEAWLRDTLSREKGWQRWITTALDLHPAVAIYLPCRFTASDSCHLEVSSFVRADPLSVTHLPGALQYLATVDNITGEVPELTHILTWCPVAPVVALSFFSKLYPQHPLTHQYAVRVLGSYPPENMIFYVPQLVQGLRYDKLQYLSESLLHSANKSPILAHQLLWNMNTNMFRDEDGTKIDPDIGNQLLLMRKRIVDNFTPPALAFYQREFEFFDQITNVSGKIREFPKGTARKKACLESLREISVRSGCYLPSNPDCLVLEIDHNSGTPMQSAAKAPYLAKFMVRKVGVINLETEAIAAADSSGKPSDSQQKPTGKLHRNSPTNSDLISYQQQGSRVNRHSSLQSVANSSPTHWASTSQRGATLGAPLMHRRSGRTSVTAGGTTAGGGQMARCTSVVSGSDDDTVHMQACIFKVGDDVRQDILALQVLRLFKNIFDRFGLELFVYPYKVVATAPGRGVIECVPDSKSRDQIGRQTDCGMYDYFVSTFGDVTTPAFQQARRNFVMSMAAYSVFCYLLQVKDRHNGNIMLDKHGHLIHIDFGFMFESSPGGNMGWEGDLKLTNEMLMIMGGRPDSPSYRWFQQLSIRAYLAVRPYQEAIVTLVALMLDTGLPCFRKQTIKLLRQRFAPTMSDREAAASYAHIIRACLDGWRTKSYDFIQFVQNQIPY